MREGLKLRLGWLVRNPHYKFLSFFIAVLAWIYVQSNSVERARLKVPVQPILAEELVTAEPLPTSVMITVEGTRLAMRRAQEGALAMPVDLSGLEVGSHGLDFSTFEVSNLPSGLQLVGVEPQLIRFELDTVESRNVEVRPVVIGEPGAGYAIREIKVTPPVVEVRGPRRALVKLGVITTRPLDVSGLVESTSISCELDIPRRLSMYEEVQPTAEILIEPTVETRTIGAIPVHIWRQFGWRAEEESVSVTLQGPSAALREVSPDEVVAFVHLPDTPNRLRYEAPFGPAEGLRLRVLHGGDDAITVTRVTPSRVQVYRSGQ